MVYITTCVCTNYTLQVNLHEIHSVLTILMSEKESSDIEIMNIFN